MTEKITPEAIKIPGNLMTELESRKHVHLLSTCIGYPKGQEETVQKHLTLLQVSLNLLQSENHEEHTQVYGNVLSDGQIIIFFNAQDRQYLSTAIIMANRELQESNLPLIPELKLE